eukprot:COSAG02_NODE_12214_length_1579_cov_3.303378_3_plen_20_part_01
MRLPPPAAPAALDLCGQEAR